MRLILLSLFGFILTKSLKADDELFSFNATLHFINKMDEFKEDEKKYVRFAKQRLTTEASINSTLSESVTVDATFSNSPRDTCNSTEFIQTAKISLIFGELVSLNIGCLNLEQGGWRSRDETHLSPFDTSLSHIFWNKKNNFALNFNIHLMGIIRFQIIEDTTEDFNEAKEGQLALNTAWLVDLFGAYPILQLGFYNKFKAYHYTIGIKGHIDNLHIRADFSRDYFIHKDKTQNQVTTEESILVNYNAHKFINPYVRFHRNHQKIDSKEINNMENHYADSNWNKNGSTLSFGNNLKITDHFNSYLNVNYKWGKFRKDEKKDKWDVRLGLKGTI